MSGAVDGGCADESPNYARAQRENRDPAIRAYWRDREVARMAPGEAMEMYGK